MPNGIDILSLDELYKLPKEQQVDLVKTWREQYKDVEIRRVWGIQQNQLYNLVQKLGLPKLKRPAYPGDIRTASDELASGKRQAVAAVDTSTEQTSGDISNSQRLSVDVTLDGIFDAESLSAQLAGLSHFLECAGGQFKISLKLESVQQN